MTTLEWWQHAVDSIIVCYYTYTTDRYSFKVKKNNGQGSSVSNTFVECATYSISTEYVVAIGMCTYLTYRMSRVVQPMDYSELWPSQAHPVPVHRPRNDVKLGWVWRDWNYGSIRGARES